jgi:hypothetical protein
MVQWLRTFVTIQRPPPASRPGGRCPGFSSEARPASTCRTAMPLVALPEQRPSSQGARHVPSEDEAWDSCSTATPGMDMASIQSCARSWLAPMGKGGRGRERPAGSRAVIHLAGGAASHSQRSQGPSRVCRPFAARCRLRQGQAKKARARLARGPMGRGQGTGQREGEFSLISSARQNPFLSSLFSTLFPVSPSPLDSILPTTHYPHPVRGPGPIDHSPTRRLDDSTRLDVAAVKWSNRSIQPRIANPTTDSPGDHEPPTLD